MRPHTSRRCRAAADDPRRRLLAIFDWLGEVIEEPEFRGCRYLAADLALSDPDHPGHAVTRQYDERIHDLIEKELRELGHPRPGSATEQLLLLINGTLAVGATRSGSHPAAAARQVAEQLLGEAA